MVACYYVLAYLGFAMPYVVNVLNAPLGKPGTFALLAVAAATLAALSCLRGSRIARAGRAGRSPATAAGRTGPPPPAAAPHRTRQPEVRTAVRPRSGA